MNVLAFSTPRDPSWRWRIVGYGGDTVEESSRGFATIAQAVADGTERLEYRAERDRTHQHVGSRRPTWRGRS